MINLMLHDLCRSVGEVFRACLYFQGLILHLDGLIALARAGVAEKLQTSFLGVVRAVLLTDFGIEHHCVCRSSSVLVEKCDNALTPPHLPFSNTQLHFSREKASKKACP